MINKNIIVTGGAGFIGSHTCKQLFKAGFTPITIDNLSNGNRDAVKWGPLVECSIDNVEQVKQVILTYKPIACMHFAAYIEVGEANKDPLKYYQNNVANTLTFLQTLLQNGVDKLVFSSTAATFGNPETEIINETHPQNPLNAYGKGKLMVENVLTELSEMEMLKSVILRYFNAAGADPECEIGERHDPETHLIPLICDAALGLRDSISIFGTDYTTKDGTCIRDYIHVADLADAHVFALQYLIDGGRSEAFNLGNGNGFSVKEVINSVRTISKLPINVLEVGRREGDPSVLVADSKKAKSVFDWAPKYDDLDTIVKHAINFRKIFKQKFN